MDKINVINYLSKFKIIENQLETSSSKLYFEFIRFMNNNNWFDMKAEVVEVDNKSVLLIPKKEAELISDRVELFFKYKDASINIKINKLLEMITRNMPMTSKSLIAFFEVLELKDFDKYRLLDFLLWVLKKELCLYNNDEIENVIRIACDTLNLRLGNVFISLLEWLKENNKVRYSSSFQLASRIKGRKKEAYDRDTYLSLYYYLFNPEYIEKHNMYQKAINNKKTAEAWTYLSVNCICALRDTDIQQIPHPRLKYSPSVIFDMIKNNRFSNLDARDVTNSILWQMNNLRYQPNKTSRYSNIPSLNFIIPESAMEHFGILFSILEAHHLQSGGSESIFIRPIKDYESLWKYLGNDISNLFLHKDFSTISASKTYMQAVELLADEILDSNNDIHHAKGYMLAALARSHKGSYGEFEKTTEVYLKDANFSGYSPEFIARELFERGVCSFIPSMLLKIVSDSKYEQLGIHNQTEMVKALNMSPYEVERFMISVDDSLSNMQLLLNKLLNSRSSDLKKTVYETLHNIGCGAAASKTSDILCILTAMKKHCPYPDRSNCLSCEFHISTKATVFLLVREFNRLVNLRDETKIDALSQKYTMLLKDSVAPVLEEIFVCTKEIYGEEALIELEELVKEISVGK